MLKAKPFICILVIIVTSSACTSYTGKSRRGSIYKTQELGRSTSRALKFPQGTSYSLDDQLKIDIVSTTRVDARQFYKVEKEIEYYHWPMGYVYLAGAISTLALFSMTESQIKGPGIPLAMISAGSLIASLAVPSTKRGFKTISVDYEELDPEEEYQTQDKVHYERSVDHLAGPFEVDCEGKTLDGEMQPGGYLQISEDRFFQHMHLANINNKSAIRCVLQAGQYKHDLEVKVPQRKRDEIDRQLMSVLLKLSLTKLIKARDQVFNVSLSWNGAREKVSTQIPEQLWPRLLKHHLKSKKRSKYKKYLRICATGENSPRSQRGAKVRFGCAAYLRSL